LLKQLQCRQSADKIREFRVTASTRGAFLEIFEFFKAKEPRVVGMDVVLNAS